MCGIFGYVGNKQQAADIVLEGLKLLEYRGYDSWGIAVKQGKKLVYEKHVGKIGDAKINLPQSALGIGHTRWATHGGVTEKNAHPHMDCTKTIAVVHNGIVENFQELKEELIEKGHKFISETDTEVIPHLVEENLKHEGFSSSVRDAFNLLKGLNAVVIANAVSKEIVAAKTGSPLICGIGDEELLVASDASAIVKHTKKVIFLKDNEMVIMGKDVQLLSLPEGKKLEVKPERITWSFEISTKGDFSDFMIKEIHEQPNVIRNIAENYSSQVEKLAKDVQRAKGTFFIGAGTASYAALAGTYMFSKIAKKHINTSVASEFNYLEDFLTKDSLIIALSQSGETIDVVEPLIRAKEKGCKIIAITNTLGSTIYRMADCNMLLNAGPEKAVASTKAYIAKVSVILMLAYSLVGQIEKARNILLKTADEIRRLLSKKTVDQIKTIAKALSKTKNIYAIGRGASYSSALEAALKIKEVSYVPTEGLAGGELKHGTIALISKGTPCIVFAPQDETYGSIISNAIEIKSRGGMIIGIGFKKEEVFDHFIEVKDVDSGSYMAQVVVAQLLAYNMAIELRLDPDKPRNLAKSVTVK
ncbi:MAG: glutamine--fructose-6-phosphate aminotransferase [Candidatus Levybacteria bacterium RIFCSPLOWO2_12_FULL_37_14]|nr:MAG: glutamine--fructose-6-phosphate aminotransferase [Candidatus Levybacteria bacterium RIFCSPLOWO2_12_FULL_37_14]